MPLPRFPPLHPKGSRGSGLVPTTRGPLKPLPRLSPHRRSVLPKHRLPARGTASGFPPKHPKIAAPSPPLAARRIPGVPGIAPAARLHQLTLLFCTTTKSGVSRAPGAAGPVGKGREVGGRPHGPPPPPRRPPASPGAGPGPGADGPARHGLVARHGVAGHGTAHLLRPAMAGTGRGSPATLSPGGAKGLGFPRAGVGVDASRARTVPCHLTRQRTERRHAHVLTLHRHFWL